MKVRGNLWFEDRERAWFGPGRIELLEQIDRHGSIAKAAKAMGMSYKSAWEALNEMSATEEEPLVIRSTGGSGGGGTRLTPRGHEYIRIYRELQTLQQKLFDLLERQSDSLEDLLALGRRLTLQTSARNQWFATVESLQCDAVGCRVRLKVEESFSLDAFVTRTSAQRMGLEPGTPVYALAKSGWIRLHAANPETKVSNLLPCTVESLKEDAQHSEVHLRLPGSQPLVALLPHGSELSGSLKPGEKLYASIDPEQIILAR